MRVANTIPTRQNVMNLKFFSKKVVITKLATIIVVLLHFGSYYGVVAHWEGFDVDKFIVTYYDKNVHLLFKQCPTQSNSCTFFADIFR